MFPLTRENAWNVLTEFTKSESLRKHALGVEAAVRGYAAPEDTDMFVVRLAEETAPVFRNGFE